MTKRYLRNTSAFLLFLAISSVSPTSSAVASGYAVGQESVTGAGTAYAGGAAAALDASTVFYNPAGMLLLDRSEVMMGGHLISPRVEFENKGSNIFNGDPLTGGDGGQGGVFVAVPNFYGVWKYSDTVRFGFGVNAPYGLITDYDWEWQGRYNEITTSLKVTNVNAVGAIRLTDNLSFGAGLNIQYAFAKLRQAIDFGTVCAGALGPPVCQGAFGLTPQSNDGGGFVNGEDAGFGFNAGLHYHPTKQTRFGIHYRSKVKFNFDGQVDFSVPVPARTFFTIAGIPSAFTDTSANFDLTIPETASVSVYHTLSSDWSLMSDITWTRWSRFQRLQIVFGDPVTPDNILETQWHNTFRASVGLTYRYSDTYLLRGGVAFDESPIDDEFRGPGIPDSDRYIVAVGFSRPLSETSSFELAYQHFFLKKGLTQRPSGTGSVLAGHFNVNVDVLSMGVVMAF